MAGYSGTPLAKKLGIKPGQRIALLGAPEGFRLPALPGGVIVHHDLRTRTAKDVLVAFFDRAAALKRRFPALKQHLATDGGLWIAWPKKASGVSTDVSDSVVRTTGLHHGLVDNKVCAIDDTWSGLRFVRRRKDR